MQAFGACDAGSNPAGAILTILKMFYHSRKLKYVVYGKIKGFEEKGDDFLPAYKWLEQYCGYFPQVWLSRSSSSITGMKNDSNKILFGFDYIKGFPVDYGQWSFILPFLLGQKGSKKILEKKVKNAYFEIAKELKADYKEFDGGYENWRDNYLFAETNQIVVPILNLKAAKKIICRNEMQKKELKKIGFLLGQD